MDKDTILQKAQLLGATSTNHLSRKTGWPRTNLRRAIDRYDIRQELDGIYKENLGNARMGFKWDMEADESVVEDVHARTLEELLEASEVNTDEWAVKDFAVSAWQQGGMPRHAVKARLERVTGVHEIEAIKAAAVEAIREAAPAPRRYNNIVPHSGLAMEVNIYDLHLGKLAHAEETGNNYDAGIAVRAFEHVLEQFLGHAQVLGVERFIFPVGNDLLHVDGEDNNTTAGTPQDTDSRLHRSRKKAIKLMRDAVQAMADIAPVDVVIIAGNHARMQESMVGAILEAYFEHDQRVVIYDAPTPRKYIRHGKTLIGFTHGDGIKAAALPLLMATEAPQQWATSEHRVFSVGHLHQRRSSRFGSIEEHNGVEVRISPSLSGSDSWHVSKGYVNNLRAAEAHVHSLDHGEIARFRASIPQDFE